MSLAVSAACPEPSRAKQRQRAQTALEPVGLGAAFARRHACTDGSLRTSICTRPAPGVSHLGGGELLARRRASA